MRLTQCAFSVVVALLTHQAAPAQITSSTQACPRFTPGHNFEEPEDLYSSKGVLKVNLTYRTSKDQYGNTLYCFMADDGSQSPTLHVNPGDLLTVNLRNAVPPSTVPAMPGMTMSGPPSSACGAITMTASSVNIHYHGTNTAPVCHQDEVIRTVINSGQTFTYNVQFPADEPPGLYWYHPHIHGIAEAAVQGGASGAIVVEGIQNVNSQVAGLGQRILIIRDNPVPGNPDPGGAVPSWDLSLNYIPVPYPKFTTAVISMKPSRKEFWRVLNASADTILDLQLRYDGAAQSLGVVALDGVPTGTQYGGRGVTVQQDHILLPPAARAEFIVQGPSASVKNAILRTLNINTGPDGDNDPTRPIATIQVSPTAPDPPSTIPAGNAPAGPGRFAGLGLITPTAQRKLYFSEVLTDPNDPNSPTNFFITVAGQKPTLFDPDNPPAIITHQGAVEDWTIENRALENHEFHMHQIHFLVLAENGIPDPNGQYQDMVNIPFWSGKGPYPNVTVRMDFRGPVIGDFVYHCHILGHEDGGMMAIIRVLP